MQINFESTFIKAYAIAELAKITSTDPRHIGGDQDVGRVSELLTGTENTIKSLHAQFVAIFKRNMAHGEVFFAVRVLPRSVVRERVRCVLVCGLCLSGTPHTPPRHNMVHLSF